VIVDFDWEWRRLSAVLDGIGSVGFEKRDVENRMKETHATRQFQSESMTGDLAADRERAQSLVIKFLRWAFGGDVLCIEPNQVSFVQVGRSKSASIGWHLVLCLSDCYLVSTITVKVRERLGKVVHSGVRDGDIESERCSRIIAVVGKEGGDLGRRVRSIVICELGDWEEIGPIVLLVVGVHSQIQFQHLICMFCLSISL